MGLPVLVSPPLTTQSLEPSLELPNDTCPLAEFAAARILLSIPFRSRPSGSSSFLKGSVSTNSSVLAVPNIFASWARRISVDALRVIT